MKIIISTITENVGGGVQVALSIINELKNEPNNTYFVFLSPNVSKQLDKNEFPSNFYFYDIQFSPSTLRRRNNSIRNIKKLENTIHPDFVFTVFGPSYWKPSAPHICGFALPWMINPDNPIHKKISVFGRFKNWLIKKYKWHHFKNECDYLWCETEDVKIRISKFFDYPLEKIFVLSNTYSAHYTNFLDSAKKTELKNNNKLILLTVSAYYLHKNLEIIKKIIPLLINHNLEFEFQLTLPNDIFKSIFSVEERKFIKNHGPTLAVDCPMLYHNADVVFLPTLLECFSANYPEAMIMGKPILTSNFSFAKNICENAAIYFNPLDPFDITNKILLMYNDRIKQQIINFGYNRVKEFPNAKQRVENLLQIFNSLSKDN